MDPRSKEEAEANYFAVNLLVPKERLRRLVYMMKCERVDPWMNTRYIAQYFGVPPTVIEYQLRAIGEP